MRQLTVSNNAVGVNQASSPTAATLSSPPQITALDQEIAGFDSVLDEGEDGGKKQVASEILNYKDNDLRSPKIRGFHELLVKVAKKAAKGGDYAGFLYVLERGANGYNLDGHTYQDLLEKTEYRFVATYKWTNFFDQHFPAHVIIPKNSTEYVVGETKTSMFNFAAELGIEVTGGVNVGFASVSSKVSAKLSAGYGREFNFEESKKSVYSVPQFKPSEETRILIWRRDTFYILQSRLNITGKEKWEDIPGMEPLREDSQKVQYQIFPTPTE